MVTRTRSATLARPEKKKDTYFYPERLTRRPQCITCCKQTSQRSRKAKRKKGGKSSTLAGDRVDLLSLFVLSAMHPRTKITTLPTYLSMHVAGRLEGSTGQLHAALTIAWPSV